MSMVIFLKDIEIAPVAGSSLMAQRFRGPGG